MAQVTILDLNGVMGPLRSFSAKAEAPSDVPANVALTNLVAICLALTNAFTYCLSITHRNLMSGEIDIGDRVRLRGVFTDPNNGSAVIDPTTITIKYKDPSGNVTTHVYGTDAEVIKEGTGIYYEDVDIDEEGKWTYKFLGTGAAVGAEESGFYVKEERTA